MISNNKINIKMTIKIPKMKNNVKQLKSTSFFLILLIIFDAKSKAVVAIVELKIH